MHRKFIHRGGIGLIHQSSFLLNSVCGDDAKKALEDKGYTEFLHSDKIPKNAFFDVQRLPLIASMQNAGLESIEEKQYNALRIHDDVVDLSWFCVGSSLGLMVRVFERVEGRTSEDVREILEDLLFGIIANYGYLGFDDPSVKTAIFDLARLEEEEPYEYFEEYTDELERLDLEEEL